MLTIQENSFVAKNLKNSIKLYVPLVYTDDIKGTLVSNLAINEQTKIMRQVAEIVDNYGLQFIKSTGSVVNKVLGEAVQESLYEGEGHLKATMDINTSLTNLLEGDAAEKVIAKTISKGADVAYDDEPPAMLNREKEIEKNVSAGVSATETGIIRVTGKNIFGKLIAAMFGGKNYFNILVKVYTISVDSEKAVNIFNMYGELTKATKKIEQKNKTFMSLTNVFNHSNKFGKLITQKMLSDNNWLNIIKGRKIGTSFAISEYIYEELKYKGIDLTNSSTVKKLVDKYGIYDMFIVRESTEEVLMLDNETYNFRSVPINKFAFKDKREIKIAID